MKFRKKPVVVEATQWHCMGDHEAVVAITRGEVSSVGDCKECGKPMYMHGWVPTLEGGHVVCPFDWIITGVKGERYPCKPDVFEQTYEEVVDG